jgi:uncharacterized protein YuzE
MNTIEPIDTRYDEAADACYVTFSRQKIVKTVEVLKGWPMILMDVDKQGRVVGVELLGVKQFGIDYFIEALRALPRQSARRTGDSFPAPEALPSFLEAHKESFAFC